MSEQNNQQNLDEVKEPEDFGIREFPIGGVMRELKFTAGMRFRLFRDIPPESIQAYVSSEAFKWQSLALLTIGKASMNMTIDEICDEFDALNFLESEIALIYQWVLQRTLNFMLKEAELSAETLQKTMPKVSELSNTLDSLKI